jgi:ornithine cyclodeaminase
VLGHIGARGSAFHNIACLAGLYPLEEVRISSKREETRTRLAQLVTERLGIKAVATASVEATVEGADIVVEATRLERPQLLIEDRWLKPGCLLVTYGWQMATDPATVARADKIVVDDWAQCCKGGQLYPLIHDGRLTRERVHAEIGEIVAGKRPGRQSERETIVFWHRGFAISDIVVGKHVLNAAAQRGVGTVLPMFDTAKDGIDEVL